MRAFSLVEVTIALGILVFGLIIMLGLLPVGLRLVKESADEAASANIVAALQADILSAPADALQTQRYQIPLGGGSDGTVLFTQEGKSIDPNSPGEDEPAYAAKWVVRERTGSSPPTVFLSVGWPALAAEPAGAVEALLVLSPNP